MSITQKDFGHTKDGQAVTLYTITNAAGNSVSIIDYGAAIQSIQIKDAAGDRIDCCLGYSSIEEYEANTDYAGACIGRVCNRIGGSQFTLNGQTYTLPANEGKNHLHGGPKGFDKQIFKVKQDNEQTLTFGYLSKDMEEGYPGEITAVVSYIFDDYDELIMNYYAWSSDDTLLNMTNHTYFNLSGEDSDTVLDHTLELYASAITELDSDRLPTGRLLDVGGTPFDFRTAKPLGQDIHADHDQLHLAGGYDHNFCLDGTGMRPCCILHSPKTNIKMYVSTDMPGVQIYTGNYLSAVPGKSGKCYQPYNGIAIETQFYPDALAHPEFPSPVLKADHRYHQTTVFQFSVDE